MSWTRGTEINKLGDLKGRIFVLPNKSPTSGCLIEVEFDHFVSFGWVGICLGMTSAMVNLSNKDNLPQLIAIY